MDSQYKGIDRGEVIRPTAPINGNVLDFRKRAAAIDPNAAFTMQLNDAAHRLADLTNQLSTLQARVGKQADALAKLSARSSLRKDAPANAKADAFVILAIDAIDENDADAFSRALAKLNALNLSADELNPRLAQIRRNTAQRNPPMLKLLSK